MDREMQEQHMIQENEEKMKFFAAEGQKLDQRNNYYKTTLSYGGAMAGNVAGVLLAIKRKSGFWGGVGWFFLLGMAGAAAGYVVGSVLDGKPK